MAPGPDQPDLPPPGTIDVQVPADSPTSFSAMSSAAPVAGAPAAETDPQRRPRRLVGPRRQRMIVFGIGVALLISAVSIGILYAKWYQHEQHAATIIVWGEPDWDGARVTVTGVELRDGPLLSELAARDNLMIRFHVPAGEFLVRVTAKDGRVLGERRVRAARRGNAATTVWAFKYPPAATQFGVVPQRAPGDK